MINWNKIFASIYYRFKFCFVIITKAGKTTSIKTAFARYILEEWEYPHNHILNYSREQVENFSPNSKSILEIRSQNDGKILTKIYDNSILLGDKSEAGWGIKYHLEFMMNTDAKLFPPRPQWEAKGYCPDEYGHWLKGNWQNYDGDTAILNRPEGLILSVDGKNVIHVDDVEDVALPLYEGRMIGQFDFSQKGWVSGKGRTAVWRDIPCENKVIEPQYLMNLEKCQTKDILNRGFKVSIMDVTSSTNSRTVIATLLNERPCGHKVPTLISKHHSLISELTFLANINSIVFDFIIRNRLGGQSLTWSVLEESVFPKELKKYQNTLSFLCAKLSLVNITFASYWLHLDNHLIIKNKNWKQLWAVTAYERLRLHTIIDAIIAEIYELDINDLAGILHNCDQSIKTIHNKDFYRTLDPKGFWRVDKEKDPELRHTVLSLVAFHELKKIGLEAFLNLNNGEGWMLPDTLRLADYEIGHDHRAQEPQPVAARLGERYLPWQLEGTIEESWQECERHAENLRKLLKIPQPSLTDTPPTPIILPSEPNYQPPTDIFGNPLAVDLFGNPIEETRSKRRKK